MTEKSMAGRTLLMSGGSRGIGLAIALRAARDGANIAFIAKTEVPDPRIPGTVYTAAAEIENAGGKALPIVGDIRDENAIAQAVAQTVDQFGGIDFVVNNASAIALQGYGELPIKRYDLMLDINARGTFALIDATLPHLLRSPDPRVLTLSPPLNLDPKWLGAHAPYTVSKYAMTMLTLGLAEQYRDQIIANCLWPATLIATAAVRNVVAGDDGIRASRRPEIMADAAAVLLTRPTSEGSGECHIDAEVLRSTGIFDLSDYAHNGADEGELISDLFL
ncbi:NAD(P)-dependent oxidoreductase [Nocardia vinacea]|uniref:SDR family oxidoreductase n=1 Tax=Nocardia vinacea TaxID=96468 RepID=UPI003419BAC3